MSIKSYLWLIPFISFIAGYQLLYFFYGINEITTPTIVGKRLPQAFAILSQHNLNPRLLAQKEEPDLPEGTILSQTPAAGSAIKPNQSIFCVISKKPKKVTCPHLIGSKLPTIEQRLKEKNIRNKIYYLPSPYPTGNCITQLPSPNEPLQDNKLITYISAGNSKSVIFPYLKGKPAQNVQAFLEDRGIVVTLIHSQDKGRQHTCKNCIVLDQRPLAGSIIELSIENPLQVQLQV